MKRHHGGRPISGRRVRRNAQPTPGRSFVSLFAVFCKRTKPAYLAHENEFKFRVWYSRLEKHGRRKFNRWLRSGKARILPNLGYKVGEVLQLGDGEQGYWTGLYALLEGEVTTPGGAKLLFNGRLGFGHG